MKLNQRLANGLGNELPDHAVVVKLDFSLSRMNVHVHCGWINLEE